MKRFLPVVSMYKLLDLLHCSLEAGLFYFPLPKGKLIGLIRRYKGHNNGSIPYSCHEAASDNSFSLNTAARNFHAV